MMAKSLRYFFSDNLLCELRCLNASSEYVFDVINGYWSFRVTPDSRVIMTDMCGNDRPININLLWAGHDCPYGDYDYNKSLAWFYAVGRQEYKADCDKIASMSAYDAIKLFSTQLRDMRILADADGVNVKQRIDVFVRGYNGDDVIAKNEYGSELLLSDLCKMTNNSYVNDDIPF